MSACSAAWSEPGAARSSVSPSSRQRPVDHRLRDRQPERLRREGLLGEVQGRRIEDMPVGHVAALVGDHLLGDLEVAGEEHGAGQLA